MNTAKPSRVIGVALLAAGIATGWGLSRLAGKYSTDHAAEPAPHAPSTAASPAERKPLYWYDPMKPDQHFDKPGKSPFMDMDLEPKYADEGAAPADGPSVSVDSRVAQSLGVRLARVERRDLAAVVRATGIVNLNERDVSIVQTRTAGFVERVYGRAPGDVVAAGAPLADVLVPEWSGAQAEYLAIRQTGDAALTQAARQRLLLLGMPPDLIRRIEASNQPAPIHTISAPAAGVIQELAVRAGMTLAPGMTLARINSVSTVWVDTTVPESQAATIVAGQAIEARLAAFPGETFKGRVSAVLPEGNLEARALRLRIELPNREGRLKAGMTAEVSLSGTPHSALAVPAEAVIRTGRRALVYVADNSDSAAGRYRPVEVRLGVEHDGYIEVAQGLAEGDQVVASGPFLIDSEASLQGVVAAPLAASAAEGAGTAPHDHHGSQP